MAWLALPLIFLVPGYLTVACWRGVKQLDFWEGLFLVPFVSILISSWLGFVLAEAGLFSLFNLCLAVAMVAIALALMNRSRFHLSCLPPPSLSLASVVILLILAAAGWAFSRPAEVVAGTFDPGVYLSTGANVVRTGGIAFTDQFVAGLTDNLRPFLLEPRWESGVGAVRLAAFWMPQAGGSTVIPAFFHLYPVWLAILYAVGGVQAALFVSPLFGILGVWALFLLARRLAGPGVGLLAAAFLAANPAEIWFARYPISEVTVQMFVLGGLALWALMETHRSRLLAVLAGAAFGLAHLAKVDEIFIVAALFGSFFLLWLFKKLDRRHWFLVAPYVVLLGHSVLHVYMFSFAYTWITLGSFLPNLTSRPALAAYAGGILALIALALIRRNPQAVMKLLVDRRRPLTLGLAGIVGALALYGYFIWPLTPDPAMLSFLTTDGITTTYLKLYREEGLVHLAWYLSPLGLLLGLAGFVFFVGTRMDRRAWPMLLLFAGEIVTYLLTAGLAYPVHFWASRRYVPIVIPALLLFASLVIVRLELMPSGRSAGQQAEGQASAANRRLLRHLVPAVLVMALLASSALADARFLGQTEYDGAIDGLQRLAGKMEDPALVLFKPRTEGNILAGPLQYLFGKTAFVLQREPDEQFYSQGIGSWLDEGHHVYLGLTDTYPRFLSAGVTYTLVDNTGVDIQVMEQSVDHLPSELSALPISLRLYRLQPASGLPYRLDMGPLRTEDSLILRVPYAEAGIRLSFKAWSGRQEPASISLLVNGRTLQNVQIAPAPSTYEIVVPAEITGGSGPIDIGLLSGAPSGSGQPGIMLEWVEVSEAN